MDRPGDQPGAIFDMDGTLLDSYHAHGSAWRQALGEQSITYGEEDFHRHFGRRNEEIIRDVYQRLGGPEPSLDHIQAIADRKEELFRATTKVNQRRRQGGSRYGGEQGPP